MQERRQNLHLSLRRAARGGGKEPFLKGGSEVSARVALGFFDWLAEPSGAWSLRCVTWRVSQGGSETQREVGARGGPSTVNISRTLSGRCANMTLHTT